MCENENFRDRKFWIFNEIFDENFQDFSISKILVGRFQIALTFFIINRFGRDFFQSCVDFPCGHDGTEFRGARGVQTEKSPLWKKITPEVTPVRMGDSAYSELTIYGIRKSCLTGLGGAPGKRETEDSDVEFSLKINAKSSKSAGITSSLAGKRVRVRI